jgi:hypothetical protein
METKSNEMLYTQTSMIKLQNQIIIDLFSGASTDDCRFFHKIMFEYFNKIFCEYEVSNELLCNCQIGESK